MFFWENDKIIKIFIVFVFLFFFVPQNVFAIGGVGMDIQGTNPPGLEDELTEAVQAANASSAEAVAAAEANLSYTLSYTLLKPFILSLKYSGLLLQTIVSAGLGLSGMILDSVINITIFEMDSFVKDNQAIKTSWEIIRDLINMLFIFGLLYISIQTIISGIGSKTRSLLVGLISAAVLINFSYLFSTILIDVSNYLTVEIHEKLGTCGNGNSISYCFSDNLKLNTAHDPTKNGYASVALSNSKKDLPDDISELVSIFTSSLFMTILAFVFLSIAIMLVIRFISLIFLLITSPVMFLGWVLPNFASISKRWFDTLTSNLLFPPLAFLFLLITLSIAGGLDVAVGEGVTGSIKIILNFILITGFSIGSLLIAKSMGATGASFATAAAGKIMFGGAAKVGRETIGRGAANLAGRVTGSGIGSVAAKSMLSSVANSTFDVRNTKSFSGVASATGLTAGKADSKGFSQLRKAKEDEIIKRYDEFGKPTESEAKQIDDLRNKMEEEFKPELKSIETAKNEIKELKEKQKKTEEGSVGYKMFDDLISNQNKIIAENRKTIKTETRGGIKTKDKDGKEIEISIYNKIEEIERVVKERQKSYLKRKTKGLTSTPASRAAARKIRDKNKKKEEETDEDKNIAKIVKGLKEKGEDDKKEDDKKAA